MTFFGYIFFIFKSHNKTKLFCFYQNFISSTVLIFQKTSFSAKNLPQAKKWLFSFFFKSSHLCATFLFLHFFYYFYIFILLTNYVAYIVDTKQLRYLYKLSDHLVGKLGSIICFFYPNFIFQCHSIDPKWISKWI